MQNISKKPPSSEKPCGINKAVKETMVKTFKPLMPANRIVFWKDLSVEEIVEKKSKKVVKNKK